MIRDLILVLLGVGIAMSCYALYTDFLGLEGYIRELKDDWIPPARSIPMHVTFLILYGSVLFRIISK